VPSAQLTGLQTERLRIHSVCESDVIYGLDLSTSRGWGQGETVPTANYVITEFKISKVIVPTQTELTDSFTWTTKAFGQNSGDSWRVKPLQLAAFSTGVLTACVPFHGYAAIEHSLR